ncbi:hypothetical protein ABW19_dt0203578 [Dactylella cylindrospora]|nr:hypothetical protein ABW19_dt0203578 [Dactylella cylindrospora]
MSFEITTPPSTDVWRKPPSTNAFNAPTSNTSTGSLKSFLRARITFSLPHRSQLVKYDQGGLLLSITKPGGPPPAESQWLKTGIEYYLDEPWIGTVCCDRWADWSVTPLTGSQEDIENPTATLELERSNDELGKSLWIYLIRKGEATERVPLREVNWIFAEEADEELTLSVSAYAARPLKKEGNETEGLVVKFKDFVIKWK